VAYVARTDAIAREPSRGAAASRPFAEKGHRAAAPLRRWGAVGAVGVAGMAAVLGSRRSLFGKNPSAVRFIE